MRVQILGSGGYFPNEIRQTACYFLPESSAVLDAGTGTFRLLDRFSSTQLDVFLSHAHLDHICGLTYLLLPMAQGHLSRVRLFGRDETLAAVREHLFSEPVFPMMPAFEFCRLADHPQIELADGCVLTHQPLPSHPGGSTAYRIDWPATDGSEAHSIAYVTDTIVDGSYDDFIQGADVLIHECYFSDHLAEWAIKTGHSHTTPVAEVARDAGVGRLYLAHIDPQRPEPDPIGLDVARAIFPATSIATDMLEFTR